MQEAEQLLYHSFWLFLLLDFILLPFHWIRMAQFSHSIHFPSYKEPGSTNIGKSLQNNRVIHYLLDLVQLTSFCAHHLMR